MPKNDVEGKTNDIEFLMMHSASLTHCATIKLTVFFTKKMPTHSQHFITTSGLPGACNRKMPNVFKEKFWILLYKLLYF